MPHIRIYIHAVWSTKCREPFLHSHLLRKRLWKHIKENAFEKGVHVNFINGYTDHCHCLIELQANQTISNVMQLIKGESSHWINENRLCKGFFEWQNDYYAVSVSESMLPIVRDYIRNQENHHSQKSFEEEGNELIEKFGFLKAID